MFFNSYSTAFNPLQVDEDVIKKVSEEGYKSILNLRGCGEPGYFDEGEVAKKYNLEFAQSPVLASPTSLNYEVYRFLSFH